MLYRWPHEPVLNKEPCSPPDITSLPRQECMIARSLTLPSKPWKGSGLSREKYEHIISIVPRDYLNDLKLEAEAEALVEKILGG